MRFRRRRRKNRALREARTDIALEAADAAGESFIRLCARFVGHLLD